MGKTVKEPLVASNEKKSDDENCSETREERNNGSSRTMVVVNERSPLLATPEGGDRLPPRTLAVVNDSTPLPEGEGILIDTSTMGRGPYGKHVWFNYSSSSESIFLIHRPPAWMPQVLHLVLDLRILVLLFWLTASAGLTGTALVALLRNRSEGHNVNDEVLEFAWNVGKITAVVALAFGMISLFVCIAWIIIYRLNYPRRLGHPFLFTTVLAVFAIVPASLGQWGLALWFFLHVPVAILVLLLRLRFQVAKATQPLPNES